MTTVEIRYTQVPVPCEVLYRLSLRAKPLKIPDGDLDEAVRKHVVGDDWVPNKDPEWLWSKDWAILLLVNHISRDVLDIDLEDHIVRVYYFVLATHLPWNYPPDEVVVVTDGPVFDPQEN